MRHTPLERPTGALARTHRVRRAAVDEADRAQARRAARDAADAPHERRVVLLDRAVPTEGRIEGRTGGEGSGEDRRVNPNTFETATWSG